METKENKLRSKEFVQTLMEARDRLLHKVESYIDISAFKNTLLLLEKNGLDYDEDLIRELNYFLWPRTSKYIGNVNVNASAVPCATLLISIFFLSVVLQAACAVSELLDKYGCSPIPLVLNNLEFGKASSSWTPYINFLINDIELDYSGHNELYTPEGTGLFNYMLYTARTSNQVGVDCLDMKKYNFTLDSIFLIVKSHKHDSAAYQLTLALINETEPKNVGIELEVGAQDSFEDNTAMYSSLDQKTFDEILDDLGYRNTWFQVDGLGGLPCNTLSAFVKDFHIEHGRTDLVYRGQF